MELSVQLHKLLQVLQRQFVPPNHASQLAVEALKLRRLAGILHFLGG